MPKENIPDMNSAKSNESPYDVLAGVIIGAHGVQGAVKIKIATSTAVSLISPPRNSVKSSVPVWLGHAPYIPHPPDSDAEAANGQLVHVKQAKEMQPGGRVLLLKLAGITDRTQAETLIGQNVYAPKERRAALADGEYFTEDLIGLDVVSDNGREFGKVTAVLQQPANDVYETDKGALIPAVKAVVQSVDLSAKKITVANILGLFQTEADELRGDEHDHDRPGDVEEAE